MNLDLPVICQWLQHFLIWCVIKLTIKNFIDPVEKKKGDWKHQISRVKVTTNLILSGDSFFQTTEYKLI